MLELCDPIAMALHKAGYNVTVEARLMQDRPTVRPIRAGGKTRIL